MSTCIYCGAENADGAPVCIACGSQLPVSTSIQKKKKKRKKSGLTPMKLILLLVLIVGILAAGVLWLLDHFSPSSRLNRAFDQTFNTLEEQIRSLDSVNNAAEVLDRMMDRKKATFYVERTAAGDNGFTLSLDINEKKKALEGQLQTSGDSPVRLRFAMKKDIFQFAMPDIAPDVYGLSLEELSDSLVVQSLQSLLGTNLSTVLPSNMSDILSEYLSLGQDVWDEFWEAVKVESLDKRNDYSVYKVSWSMKDLSELQQKDTDGLLADAFYRLLNKIDGGCTCYVNQRGQVSKVEAAVGANLYTVSLSEQGNLWENFAVSSTGSEKPVLEGKVLVSGQSLQASLHANGSENLFDLNYRGDTRTFEFRTSSLQLKGSLDADGDTVKLQLDGDGTSKTTVEFGELSETPELLSKKYVDLMDIGLGEISELAIRFATNSEKIKAVWALFSSLVTGIQP